MTRSVVDGDLLFGCLLIIFFRAFFFWFYFNFLFFFILLFFLFFFCFYLFLAFCGSVRPSLKCIADCVSSNLFSAAITDDITKLRHRLRLCLRAQWIKNNIAFCFCPTNFAGHQLLARPWHTQIFSNNS